MSSCSDYMEHVQSQIENPASAASKVPFMLEGAYEYIDRVRWMPTHDPQTDYMERELRKEAVHRLALGMDFPPEFLLGMTDANHWTARQVVYDMWRSYGTPVAERFADDLADSYLRPALAEEDYPDWQNVVISYDDSQVVISPDRTEDADKAYDRGQINDEGYLVLKGINADFAASEEEKRIMLAIKLRNPACSRAPRTRWIPRRWLPLTSPVRSPHQRIQARERPACSDRRQGGLAAGEPYGLYPGSFLTGSHALPGVGGRKDPPQVP